jgi:hypothetical protein
MKQRKPAGSIDKPFFPVTDEIWFAPAWRAMSLGARMLYLALRRRYNYAHPNNGRIFLSQREAEKELGSRRHFIARWLRELQHFGFIVLTSAGRLGFDGYGRAARWRLTELPCKDEPPTKDFLAWNGSPFADQKTESRPLKRGHPGPQKGARGDGARMAHKKGPYTPAHKRGPVLKSDFHKRGRNGVEGRAARPRG